MNAPLTDPMLGQLQRLPAAAPDETHAASVRARCHAAIGRRRRAEIRRGTRVPANRTYEMALVAGFTLVYLLLVIYDTLSMYGAV